MDLTNVPAATQQVPVQQQESFTPGNNRLDFAKLVPTELATRQYQGAELQTYYQREDPKTLLSDYVRSWGTTGGDFLNQLLISSGYVSKGSKVRSSFIRGYENAMADAQAYEMPLSELLFQTSGSTARSGTGAGGGPFRSETTSITQYDNTNVSDIANAAYRARLGRNATKKERQIMADILNQEQRKNPQITISEGTTAGGAARGTVSTTTTQGGIDPTEIAIQAAMEDEDYEETFNKVVAFDLMKRVIDRPV
jgi:hypothetical protein